MKYSKVSTLAGFMLLAANAYALEGRVVDQTGRPVAGARIEALGVRGSVFTDESGQFTLDAESVSEIHVTAEGYSHRSLHLEDNPGSMEVVLRRTVIEQVDVVGVPMHLSTLESAMPVNVLRGEALRNQQAATLGDALEGQVGVQTNFHGNVASTPVIRGLSGPRVLITQNGLDVSDVSRVGPDHAVSSEVSTAQQVEILRGPATLFYGSGAIGGVVNVVDGRVPKDNLTRGEWQLSHETVNSQELAAFNVTSGAGALAVYADGFWREGEDYEVPVPPEAGHDDETEPFTVPNSAEESYGFTLGTSYLLDNGYAGISFGQLDRQYGIPGHGDHGDEPVAVYADLEQNRVQFLSELTIDHDILRAINSRAAYTAYTHSEVENGVVGTVFDNTTTELSLDLLHQVFADWKGGVVLDYKNTEISAVGEEAFTPPSSSKEFAVAVLEERHFGDVLIQLGARLESVVIEADSVKLPPLELHSHGDTPVDSHGGDEIRVFDYQSEFIPVSVSAGAVWDFATGYNAGISLSRSQRAPSASELLSFGPHIGTRSYEVGALFELHEEHGEAHFELNHEPLELETANNLDLTLRKHEGDLGFILNVFYNQVDNFYYQRATGLYTENSHDHDHDHADEHSADLPVYLHTSEEVVLVGYEAQVLWQLSDAVKTRVFSDYVRAELADSGAYLPRESPRRLGASVDYEWKKLSANASWTHYYDQDHVAVLEQPTQGYDWLDATLTYHLPLWGTELALFVKGENLTDTEARVHTSFIKDLAPRPGRNFRIGVRGSF